MLRVWAMIVLAGCSFEPGGYGPGDGAIADDARRDGTPSDGLEPDAAPIPITFVQAAVYTNAGNNSFSAAAFPAAQVAGNLNVVVISWGDQADMVAAVGDTNFNMYFSATSLLQSQGFSQRIYYAPNIKAGANLVTVGLTGNAPSPKIRIFEYSGIVPALPVDMSMAAGGSTATASVGPVNTTQARELLFAANTVGSATTGPGTDFTERQLDAGDLVEDRVVDVTGAYTATAPLTSSGNWIMQLVSFKGIQ
jgi:hypothetical protein